MSSAVRDAEKVQIRVDNLNFRRADNIRRGIGTFSAHIQLEMRHIHVVQLHANLLQVQHYLDYIFAYARNGAEFVHHVRNAHSRNRSAFQRGKQNTANRVAHGNSKTAFQWADCELPGLTALFLNFHFWCYHIISSTHG